MTATFFGHGNFQYENIVINELEKTIEQLIKKGVNKFLLGGYGNFDKTCAEVICSLKIKYPDIKSILVIPYLNRKYNMNMYDESIYPPLEKIPLKLAIIKRNQWMIENSEIVVTYVKYSWGGANKSLEYAKQKRKTIINIADTL